MIVAILQARTGSTRLSNKILLDIAGKTLLEHFVERVRMSRQIEKIVIATTTQERDQIVVDMAKWWGVDVYWGSEEDVLDRFYQAATRFGVDPIVRVTPDCPLIDPQVVDRVIQRYLRGDCDYASNTVQRTYPDGLDVEVFSRRALERAWQEANLASEREHVTAYIWKNPDKFRLANVENSPDLSHLRWSVDRREDLEFVRQVYKHLYKKGQAFYMEDVLELLRKYPALQQINAGILINEGYAKSLREDRTVR